MFPFRDSPARIGAALILALGLALPAGAQAAENAVVLRRALAGAAAADWQGATRDARISGPLAEDIIAWHQLRAGQGSFADYAEFTRRNADWPGMELLRRKAEASIRADIPPAQVIDWFADTAPLTGAGLRHLVAAIAAQDGRAAAQAALIAHWEAGDVPLDAADENALVTDWAGALTSHHAARARALLDRGDWKAAQRALPRLAPADRPLIALRIDLQSGGAKLEQRLAALSDAQKADPGLNLDRFRWRMREKDIDGARVIMQARSTSAEALADPAAWAGLRIDLARASLRDGDAVTAHALASAHFMPAGQAQTIELDWLAGYTAFKLGQWDAAARHFKALQAESQTAITQGRALYWLALTAGARGDSKEARALMQRAATHQSSWYGQIAAEAIGAPMDPALVQVGRARDTLPDWRGSALMHDRRVQAAIWLFIAGEPNLAQRFLLHISETTNGEDSGRLARLMDEFGQPHFALRLAKAAAREGQIYPAALFPLTGLERSELGIPPELLMAIARRESEFNPVAQSPSGARGLMQVMPATAEHIAVDVGLPYDLAQLSANPVYNAMYGATYLAGLRARYGPSIALVAAGYNAGPGRSAQWLKAFGDLRAGADPVDWVEAIPFDETRNYVMRVAEALPIYRARIAGHPVAFTPLEDLTGGGVTSVPIPQPVLTLATSPRPVPSPRMIALLEAALELPGATDADRQAAPVATDATAAANAAEPESGPAPALLPAPSAGPGGPTTPSIPPPSAQPAQAD